ncbi:MAG: hypothetical protein ACK553_08160 [Planctomycetota bacterium]
MQYFPKLHRCRIRLFPLLLVALASGQGCSPSPNPTSGKEGSEKTDAKSPVVASLRGADEIVPGSTEDAKQMITSVFAKYRAFKSYSDAGELRLETPGSQPVTMPFRIAFERPNRLSLAVLNAAGTWTSTTWEGVASGAANPYPNQRLVRPLPDSIDFGWIAGDYLGGLLVEPIGIPIQLEWLLSNQSLEALSDPTCKLEFLLRDTADGRSCDRIRMDIKGLRWVFWIDRENQLVRKMELPPRLFYPGTADERLAGVRCEIDFPGAVANQAIDWSLWKIPERANDVQVRRMVMPPPIASTQILGATLQPFDLKSADGKLLLDAAEPKRPITVLCWIDGSPASEATVRELMVFRKALVDQELGGRCGIYLIAREPVAELAESLKKWNCDLPLAADREGLSDSLFKVSTVPSLIILDRERRVQVAETLSNPIYTASIIDLVRRIDSKEDLASRQMQQDADNQARFIAALHRVAVDKEQAKRLDPIREFQFALHGMRRIWRTQLDAPLVSAGGAWYPNAAVSEPPKTDYPFAGTSKPIVMSILDNEGKILAIDDLGNKIAAGQVESEQADGAVRIHTAIDPWSHQWIAIVPEGLPRFWIAPVPGAAAGPVSQSIQATTYNIGDLESPLAFAWTSMNSEPTLAIATSESRLLVINPKTEKRLDALGEATIAIAPGLDAEGRVAQWSALSATGRMVRIRNLTNETGNPMEARLEQVTFSPRPGAWLWGRQQSDPVTFCLAGLPSGEAGVVVSDLLHRAIRSRPITAQAEQARLLSTARLADGTLYALASGPNRVLHLFTADLQIMDQVSFDSRIFGAALVADGQDLKLVVALEKEISAWSIDVPDRPSTPNPPTPPSGPSGTIRGQ